MLQGVLGGFRSAASWAAAPVPLTELLVQLRRLQAGPLFWPHRALNPRDHRARVVVLALPDFDPLKHTAESRHRPPGDLTVSRASQRRREEGQVLGVMWQYVVSGPIQHNI